MTSRILAPLLLWTVTTAVALAEATNVKLRTLCLQRIDGIKEVLLVSGDPANPKLTPLPLYTSDYSDEVAVTMNSKTVRFAIKKTNGKGEEELQIVAEGQLNDGARQVAVFLPSGKKKQPYRTLFMNESATEFPMGSTRIVNYTSANVQFIIGEHGLMLKPGKVGMVPLPQKVNSMNQCTVKLYYQDNNGVWILSNSSGWKVSDRTRTMALTYIHPRTKRPTVNSFRETPPWLEGGLR